MRFLLFSLLLHCVTAIWPAPQEYTHGSSALWIDEDINVVYNGGTVRWSSHSSYAFSDYWRNTKQFVQLLLNQSHCGCNETLSTQDIVESAINRAFKIIFAEHYIPWKAYPRNELNNYQPSANDTKTYISQLTITQTGNDTDFKALAGEIDESYTLNITSSGAATISANSYLGALYALQTFTQLFYEHSTGCGVYTNLAPVSITDSPRFAWRGLNMDVSRNWYPKQDILRTIDALAWNKFNRIHIHMTDAQSWPMDIPAFPELSEKGAYQTGLSYTPDDVAEIQQYAVLRGVQPIIEFDMPGHTSSIAYSHPELITAFDAHPWSTYCAEPPCGSLKLNSSDVYDFLEKLFDDVLPRTSPYSSYFHTGGDEVNVNAYLLDDTVNSNSTAVLIPLMQKFVDRNHDQVRAAGLQPIAWEEMLLTWNLTLGDDVVVQTWLSDTSISEVTARGHKALFGNYEFWYLDCGKGQWLDFDNGASFQEYYPFLDYCSPLHNWRQVYSYDPTAALNDTQKDLVLGGEVHIWSEQTDPVNLDDMVWPRASAAGEVMWSGRQDASGTNRSQIDASPRLDEMRERMVHRGIKCGPVQMVFCTQANATECSL